MNAYIEKFKRKLPLLEFCSGPSTQEDGIIKYLLSVLELKSDYFVDVGGGGLRWRKTRENCKRNASKLIEGRFRSHS